MKEAMLTTTDNPYNPFTQFEDWYRFDVDKGYCTCDLLSRCCPLSSDLSETEMSIAIDTAMLEIVKYNLSGVHKIVYRDV